MAAAECECDGDKLPGAAWPMASDSDDAHPYVERCDLCQRFDCDEDAANALVSAGIGVLVIHHRLYDDVPRNRWQPAVYPDPREDR
jgi:hypothetical protein